MKAQEVNLYGIENLKAMLKFLFLAVIESLTIDKNSDGKTSISEILSAITTVSFRFPALYEAFPWLKKEYKDLNDEEREELRLFVESDLDLPMKYDNIEEAIKLTVNALAYNYRYAKKMKEIFSRA